jgi:hypothetical protein
MDQICCETSQFEINKNEFYQYVRLQIFKAVKLVFFLGTAPCVTTGGYQNFVQSCYLFLLGKF